MTHPAPVSLFLSHSWTCPRTYLNSLISVFPFLLPFLPPLCDIFLPPLLPFLPLLLPLLPRLRLEIEDSLPNRLSLFERLWTEKTNCKGMMVRQWSVSRIWKYKFSTWEADCVFTLFQFLKITSSLDASLHLYESACPSVAPSVHDAYVMLMLYFGKKMRKIENFMCRNDKVGIEVMDNIKTAL